MAGAACGGQGRAAIRPIAWLALLASLGCGIRGPAAAPSIVLITIDTLRADRLSSYGYPLATSPNLDWLAERGVRFEYALAPSSSTAPTHASIFTGRYPSSHSIGAFNSQFALDDEWPTLAERLAAAGYATAAVVSNPLLARPLGLDRGFAHYDDDTRGEGRFAAKGRRAGPAVDRALAWLDASPAEPFFLWLQIQDTHGPYAPDPDWTCPVGANASWPTLALPLGLDPSGFRAIPRYQAWDGARELARYAHRYDCELAGLDAQLGRLLARTAYDRQLRDALVVVTADHGEAFGEDDFYFAHGHAIGLDQVHVPLIAAGGGLPAGRVIERPVGLVALFASLLELAGVGLAGAAEGASLLGLLEGADPEPVFVESLNQVGVATGGVFARRDLRPASDAAFWDGGNPNSGGGHWQALPGPRVSPLDGEATAAAARGALQSLDEYAARALAARLERRASRRQLELTPEQQAALRRLGYAQ